MLLLNVYLCSLQINISVRINDIPKTSDSLENEQAPNIFEKFKIFRAVSHATQLIMDGQNFQNVSTKQKHH